MSEDIKSKLKRADDLLRQGKHAAAVAVYLDAADVLADNGHALKAVAIQKQTLEIVERSTPHDAAARSRALRGLLSAYATLGMESEAAATRRKLD